MIYCYCAKMEFNSIFAKVQFFSQSVAKKRKYVLIFTKKVQDLHFVIFHSEEVIIEFLLENPYPCYY